MKIKVLHSETQAEVKQINLSHLMRAEGSCFIGRSQASGLSLDSPSVSRLHGKFSHHDGQYYFCDLGSSNGSLIQGEIALANQEYLLQAGQVIRLGDFVLVLETVPELQEEPSETVMESLDKTVVSTYVDSSIEHSIDSGCDGNESNLVIEAELVKESSALVKLTPAEVDDGLQTQTKALFVAINQRILSELRAAGNLSRDTYLKAIRSARASIEQERLIDPEQVEKEAEKHWQSLVKNTSALSVQIGSATARGASSLGNRLGAAAKAAWSEFSAQRHPKQTESAPQTELNLPIEKPSVHESDASESNTAESDPAQT